MASKNQDLLKKSLTLGLGLMDLTRDKVEKMVNEMQKGISKQDKKKAVDELFKSARSAKADAEKTLKSQVKKVLNDLGTLAKSKANKIK